MNLKLLFDEAMERHDRVLNKVAADIAGQLSDPELRRQAAAMLVMMLVAHDEDSDEGEGEGQVTGLARLLHANMPR